MNNVKMYRGLKGYSQSELAKMLGITRQALITIEKGTTKNLSQKKIEKICSLLDITPVKLLGEGNFRVLPNTKEEVDYMIKLLEVQKENL